MCQRLDERLRPPRKRMGCFSGLTPSEVGWVERFGAANFPAPTVRIIYNILTDWQWERDDIAAEIKDETARQEWLLYFKEDSDAVEATLSALRPYYIP